MYIVGMAEIHFHKQEQLSVFLESNSSGDFEKAAEIGLLTMVVLRTLNMLAGCPEADNLARILNGAREVVGAFAARQATGGFELIPYPGFEGRKRFYPKLELHDNLIQFEFRPTGFDERGTGLNYYAPIAVLGLLRELAIKRANDRDYLARLVVAAVFGSNAHTHHHIDSDNEVELGVSGVMASCGELLQQNWLESRE